MSMKSLDLLPALQVLPQDESAERKSFRDMIVGLVNTDRTMYAAEFASATSFGLWPLFAGTPLTDGVNVDDATRETIKLAHELKFKSESRSVWEHHQDALNNPETYDNTFMNNLKAGVAEIHYADELNQAGGNIEPASRNNQPGWDLHGTGLEGNYTQIQVKTGGSISARDIQEHMDKYPLGHEDYADHYAMGTELYDKVQQSGIDVGERTLADIGSDYALVDGMKDALDTLSGNMGIAIPDGVVDVIPYAPAIVGGVRLIYGVLKTERDFKAAERTTRNQIQVVQTLTLMSRIGVATVLASTGGMVGGTAGSAIPGVGNFVAGTAGTVIGAGAGMYLNKHLRPHMLEIALNITGLTEDDLFYYKNKQRIDDIAGIFQTRATELTAAPGF